MLAKKKPKIIERKIKTLYKISFDEFTKQFEIEVQPIVKVLKEKKSNRELKRHLKNYFIIRIVTMVEDYYRSKAYHIVDEHDLKITELLDSVAVDKMLSEDSSLTKGQILATNFSFQNPADIDLVFSKLLNIQFAIITSALVALLSLVSEEVRGTILWEDFSKLSNLRNNIVHNMRAIVEYDVEEIQTLARSIIILLAMSESVIEYELSAPIDKKISTAIKSSKNEL